MRTFWTDFERGCRGWTRTPGIAIMAVLALVLGIGANTAIFSVVQVVLWDKLPVADPDQLVTLVNFHVKRGITSGASPYADVAEWRRELSSFSEIAAMQRESASLAGDGVPERVMVGKVNANFFPMLGVHPTQGRGFTQEEDRAGAGAVALISDELWRRRFGRKSAVLGSTVDLDGKSIELVGVLPARFRFTGAAVDVWVPLALSEARGQRNSAVSVYARLKPGIAAEMTQPELARITEQTRRRVPQYKEWELRTATLQEWITPDVRGSLLVLLGAVGFTLLIACANVANLLLARAAHRRRETAIRAALGASRWQLVRQFLVESLPLGMLGTGLGLLLAWWCLQLLPSAGMQRIPRLEEARLDATVLAFTAGVSLLTCVLFGLAPAVIASRTHVQEMLQESGRSSGAVSLRGARLRSGLVVLEVSLAVLLAIGASLMARTFYLLSTADPGFQTGNLLTATVELPRAQFQSKDMVHDFYRRALQTLEGTPGVKSVALTSSLPLGGNYFRGVFLVEGVSYNSPWDAPALDLRAVDANYFDTLKIPLRRGRGFTLADREGAPRVAVINEAAARRLFGDRDPLGMRIAPGDKDWLTIVGVTADIKHTDVAMDVTGEVLLPFWQNATLAMTFIVRTDPAVYPDAAAMAPVLRRLMMGVSRQQAVYRIETMEQIMSARLAPRRLNMTVLALFALLGVVLAGTGIYGVLSYSVQQRTYEIGVRMALGAGRREVTGMVVRQGLLLAGAGLVMGLGASFALTRLLSRLLYGVRATDPWVFAGAALLLIVVAAAASYQPARRATSIDPLDALRST